MAIPPTLKDLNRVKSNLVNPIRRFPIATTGENFIDIKLNKFATPDILAVDSTNTLGVSADLNLSPKNLNTGDFILNTISENNTIFSPGSIEVSRNIGGDKVTDSPNHVLYYQGPKPIEVSNNLVQPLPDENFEIRVSFYNEENSNQSTASFPISVINFSNTDKSELKKLQGSLFNTNVLTISTNKFNNTGRKVGVGFNITLLDKANKRFLKNSLLLTDPISVFKDNIFLTSINEKSYPNLSQSRPISAQSNYSPGKFVNNARLFAFCKDYSEFTVPLSSTGIVEDLKTNPGKVQSLGDSTSGIEDYKYSLGAYKNIGLEDGIIIYEEYLSAGNYEFKFNIKDKNNKFNNNNISSSFSLSVIEVEKEMVTPSLSAIVRAVSGNPNYTNFNHLRLFSDTPATTGATWNTDFWGFSARDLLNFSGVAWRGNGSSNNNITLITPRHGIAAEHYRGFNQQCEVGQVDTFIDHTTGNPVSATVLKVFHLANFGIGSNSPYDAENKGNNFRSISAFFDIDELTNTIDDLSGSRTDDRGAVINDCSLVLFDRDLTSGGDIKAYPIAKNMYNDYIPHTYPAIPTGGRLRHTDGDNVGLGTIKNLSRNRDDTSSKPPATIPYSKVGLPNGQTSLVVEVNNLSATNLKDIFTDSGRLTAYQFEKGKVGDSGNPNFLILDNKLCFIMDNKSEGYNTNDEGIKVNGLSGPDFTSPDTQVVLQSAIDLIGNPEGYELSAVEMV